MLIVFSGLPGTGKTTISQLLARRCSATYLRMDSIEQAMKSPMAEHGEVGIGGYLVAYQIAKANLMLGSTVVVDAVNPVQVVRQTWRAVAEGAGSRITEVEVVCSDPREHRRRVESRVADIPGHSLPTWSAVQQLAFEPWSGERLVIDSAIWSAVDAAAKVFEALKNQAIPTAKRAACAYK